MEKHYALKFCTQENAEVAVKDMLREIAKKRRETTGTSRLTAVDYMDDGSQISLKVDIDEQEVGGK